MLIKEFIRYLLSTQTAYRQVFQQKIKEKNIDLSYEMLQIMSHLFSEEMMNQQEIAYKTFRDKSSLSYILKNMEKKGFITKIEDTKDKRNKLITLTPKGISIQEKVHGILNEVYENTFKSINPEIIYGCIEYLNQIENIFKQNFNEN